MFCNFKKLFLVCLFYSQSFASYSIGDQISLEHQAMNFSFCYPDSLYDNFSLSDNSNKIILLEMSASWWGPCYNSIPEGEAIYEHWKDHPKVKIVHFLDDLNQPYSCREWGSTGDVGIPPIVDDGIGYNVFEWFDNPSGAGIFPLIVFIDHNMTVANVLGTSPSTTVANIMIQNLIDNIPIESDDLSKIDSNGILEVENFEIRQLYPNPFNPSLNIEIKNSFSEIIKIDIIDINGQLISTLYSGLLNVGIHYFNWNAKFESSGVYFISFSSDKGPRSMRKVVLIK